MARRTVFYHIKEKIILELTEKYLIHNFEYFKGIIHFCKSEGFRIAIDDLAAGFVDQRAVQFIGIDPRFLVDS